MLDNRQWTMVMTCWDEWRGMSGEKQRESDSTETLPQTGGGEDHQAQEENQATECRSHQTFLSDHHLRQSSRVAADRRWSRDGVHSPAPTPWEGHLRWHFECCSKACRRKQKAVHLPSSGRTHIWLSKGLPYHVIPPRYFAGPTRKIIPNCPLAGHVKNRLELRPDLTANRFHQDDGKNNQCTSQSVPRAQHQKGVTQMMPNLSQALTQP